MQRALRSPNHPEVGWALLGLGRALQGEHRLPQSLATLREAMAVFRANYSHDHRTIDTTLQQIGILFDMTVRCRDNARSFGETETFSDIEAWSAEAMAIGKSSAAEMSLRGARCMALLIGVHLKRAQEYASTGDVRQASLCKQKAASLIERFSPRSIVSQF